MSGDSPGVGVPAGFWGGGGGHGPWAAGLQAKHDLVRALSTTTGAWYGRRESSKRPRAGFTRASPSPVPPPPRAEGCQGAADTTAPPDGQPALKKRQGHLPHESPTSGPRP